MRSECKCSSLQPINEDPANCVNFFSGGEIGNLGQTGPAASPVAIRFPPLSMGASLVMPEGFRALERPPGGLRRSHRSAMGRKLLTDDGGRDKVSRVQDRRRGAIFLFSSWQSQRACLPAPRSDGDPGKWAISIEWQLAGPQEGRDG